MKGLVMRIISKFCDVITADNVIYRCQVKGVLKLSQSQVLVGDNVDIEVINESEKQGLITAIYPRKNELLRPTVSNVDQVIIVTALKQPNFSSFLLNKYLIWVEAHNLQVVLVFTKEDLGVESDIYEKLASYEQLGYPTIILSTINQSEQWQKLRDVSANKISILSGQTGAGKSSLLNVLDRNLNLRTQAISKALNRGKHTTTHKELIVIDGNIRIIDSPGFSSFSLSELSLEVIASSFHFFKKWKEHCQFKQCLHWKEPHCAVKNALVEERLPQFIYDDYIKVLEQLSLEHRREVKKWRN